MKLPRRFRRPMFVLLAVLTAVAAYWCYHRTPQERFEDRLTEGFATTCVRPLTDPILVAVEKSGEVPPGLLASNHVLRVTCRKRTQRGQILFENQVDRPPSNGDWHSGAARGLRVFYPKDLGQPEVEAEMTYFFCEKHHSVSVNVAVPNPLLSPKIPNPASAAGTPCQRPRAKPEEVVVEVLDAVLPEVESERKAFLWSRFANRPEEQKFENYTTDRWRENYAVFADALTKKAAARGLDAESLRKMLELILKHSKGNLAYLPVGAYQTTLSGHPIWIVTVKWEGVSDGCLGHIRMFAFDQRTLQMVGFNTCM